MSGESDEAAKVAEAIARAFGRAASQGPVTEAAFDAAWSTHPTPKGPADRAVAEAFGRPVERDGFQDLREAEAEAIAERERALGNLPALRSELLEALCDRNKQFYRDPAVGERMAAVAADATIKSLQEWGLRDGWSREQFESRLHDRIVEAGGKRTPVHATERKRSMPRAVITESDFDALWGDNSKEK